MHHEPSRFSADEDEFLSRLGENGVEYVIVHGEAVIFYGHAGLTGDIDVFYRRSADNVERLYRALEEFWAGDIPGIERKEELMQQGTIFQFGVPPNRIDLLNDIEAIQFEEAWKNRVARKHEIHGRQLDLNYIGIDDLIRNKAALGLAQGDKSL